MLDELRELLGRQAQNNRNIYIMANLVFVERALKSYAKYKNNDSYLNDSRMQEAIPKCKIMSFERELMTIFKARRLTIQEARLISIEEFRGIESKKINISTEDITSDYAAGQEIIAFNQAEYSSKIDKTSARYEWYKILEVKYEDGFTRLVLDRNIYSEFDRFVKFDSRFHKLYAIDDFEFSTAKTMISNSSNLTGKTNTGKSSKSELVLNASGFYIPQLPAQKQMERLAINDCIEVFLVTRGTKKGETIFKGFMAVNSFADNGMFNEDDIQGFDMELNAVNEGNWNEVIEGLEMEEI